MQSSSRESLQVVESRFDEITAGLDSAGLTELADDLVGVAQLLDREVLLRKSLVAGTDDAAPKQTLVESLFTGKIGSAALALFVAAAGQRWSRSRDLIDALARSGSLAVLVDAERASQLDNTEDELFRFGLTLDVNQRLVGLLSDSNREIGPRQELADSVLEGKVSSYTQRLVRQAIALLRGGSVEVAIYELAELAASRRGRSAALVKAAAPLSDEQNRRLTDVLSRIYGRAISVQLDIDPTVLGGLSITVGDEVVDGTIASKLAKAASQLPR